jgi:hypothetical protein
MKQFLQRDPVGLQRGVPFTRFRLVFAHNGKENALPPGHDWCVFATMEGPVTVWPEDTVTLTVAEDGSRCELEITRGDGWRSVVRCQLER